MRGLPELVLREKQARGLSYQDMANLTGIPKPTLSWICRQDDFFYTDLGNIQAIASGLGLPLAEVQLAAIESSGLAPETRDMSSRVERIRPALDTLDDVDFETVLALARRLADQ